MFEFMFGGKKRIEFVRDLIEERMSNRGAFDSRTMVKELSNIKVMSGPEATMLVIIELVAKYQKERYFIGEIINTIENQRKIIGSNPYEFSKIIDLTSGDSSDAAIAIPMYVNYRLQLEHAGSLISEDEFTNIFQRITKEYLKI